MVYGSIPVVSMHGDCNYCGVHDGPCKHTRVVVVVACGSEEEEEEVGVWPWRR